MDNDALIDQARVLYAGLLIKRDNFSAYDHDIMDQCDRLIIKAYCRYVRRLNRCVLCYQFRADDCNRIPGCQHTHCSQHYPYNQSEVLLPIVENTQCC